MFQEQQVLLVRGACVGPLRVVVDVHSRVDVAAERERLRGHVQHARVPAEDAARDVHERIVVAVGRGAQAGLLWRPHVGVLVEGGVLGGQSGGAGRVGRRTGRC